MRLQHLLVAALTIFTITLHAQSGPRNIESIGLNDISIIEIAGNGDIWAGSSAQGLAFYNSASGSWAYYNTSNTPQLQSDNITAIWANTINGTQHAVVGNTSGATDFVNSTPVALTSLPQPIVRGVVYRPDSLWILTNNQLTRYDSSIVFANTFDAPLQNITCSRRGIAPCGGFWAGTANNGCFYTVDGVNYTFIDTSGPNQRLVDNRVNAIAIDNQCIAKFIGTKGGFSMCPVGSPCQNFTTANGLPQNDITSVATACGKVWLGTRDSGVVVFSPPSTFTRVTTADGLPDNRVTAISCNMLNCQAYISTVSGSVTVADSAGSVVKQITAIGKIAADQFAVKVYPQPAGSEITFVLETATAEGQLQLTDIAGRVVDTYAIKGQQQLTIPINGLQQGMYFYQLYKGAQVVKTGKIDVSR